MSERQSLSVSIDWKSMFFACIDAYCACGEHFHVDVWNGTNKSPEHIRCPHCSRVYRMTARTAMTREQVDFDTRIPEPHTFVQWKGTELHGTAHCDCGNDIGIRDLFAYEVDCTACSSHFHVNPHVRMTELTADEVAALPPDSVVTEDGPTEDEQEIARPGELLLLGDILDPVTFGKGGTDIQAAESLFQRLRDMPPAKRSEPLRIIVLPDLHVGQNPVEIQSLLKQYGFCK